jgi:hypothetical protein
LLTNIIFLLSPDQAQSPGCCISLSFTHVLARTALESTVGRSTLPLSAPRFAD